MSSSSSISTANADPQKTKDKKTAARVALIALDESSAAVLHDCFHQFGIHTVALPLKGAAERLQREKFEACVLHLNEGATELLQAARSSASNRRMVVYGLADSTQAALQFSKFGINAVLTQPMDRSGALKVVRSTYFLVLHEFRRYVRVPLTEGVTVNSRAGSFSGVSVEMSGGGMSVELRATLDVNAAVELTFSLPGESKMGVKAVVCWTKPDERLAGFRFDANDPRREKVKKWLEEYLEIS